MAPINKIELFDVLQVISGSAFLAIGLLETLVWTALFGITLILLGAGEYILKHQANNN